MIRTICDILILAVLLIAPALGGGVAPWAWSILLASVGILLIVWAPQRRLGGWADAAVIGLIILALCAFLPSAVGLQGAWRPQLAAGYRLKLPDTVSPQPWLTFESFLLLLLGVGWMYLTAGREWSPTTRARLTCAACLGLMVITLLALAQYFAGVGVPLWPSEHHFGPFPNRNQNATLFAMGAIMSLPLLEDCLKKKNPQCILWFCCLFVFVAAIAFGRSRAGVLLLAVGTALWLLQRGRLSPRTGIVGLGVALGVAALMMVFGGESVQRLLKGEAWARLFLDWRWAVHRDAFVMAGHAGAFGVGLGNFDAVFALFRNASLGFNRPIHPESDALWVAAELGPLAIPLLLVIAISLGKRLFPMGTHLASLRSASLAVLCVAGLHAFIDVSLHRPGTFFLAVFFVALGLHVRPAATSSKFARPALRLLGGTLLMGALWIGLQVWGETGPPGTTMLERHLLTATQLRQEGSPKQAEAHLAAALRIAPLDWRLHREKGILLADSPRWAEAARAFRLVRRLEPGNVWIPLSEIWAWLNSSRPRMAIPAIVACAKRESYDTERADLSAAFIFLRRHPETAQELLELLSEYPSQALSLVHCAQMVGPEVVAAAAAWIASDPELNAIQANQREEVFEILWRDPAHRLRVLDAFARKERWTRPAWRLIAREKAAEGRHQKAVEILREHIPPPALPPLGAKDDRRKLERDLQINAANYAAAYHLLAAYREVGFLEEAAALCEKMVADPQAPKYWLFLQGEIEIARGRWEEAWKALKTFDNL